MRKNLQEGIKLQAQTKSTMSPINTCVRVRPAQWITDTQALKRTPQVYRTEIQAKMACRQKSKDLALENRKQCDKLARAIRDLNVKEEHILARLDKIIECENKLNAERFNKTPEYSFARYRYPRDMKGNITDKGDLTLLHLAVSCKRDEVASRLNDKAPSLSKASRTDDEFKGQTPFHIAVAKQKHALVKEMMDTDMQDGIEELLNGKAQGSSLKGTIMMGETPLSIAVLNCDDEMIPILLENRDSMVRDSFENTVMHTVVMYAYLFPERTNESNPHFKRATQCLQKVLGDKKFRTLMHIQNGKGQTPLQLACKKGLDMVFDYFVNLKSIYKFTPDIWGVEDTYCYDITEIDTVHWIDVLSQDMSHQYQSIKLRPKSSEAEEEELADCCQPCEKHRKIHKRPSVLQAISYLPFKDGSRFMSGYVMEEIISKKWDYYKRWFCGFGIAHLIIMIVVTWDTIAKTEGLSLKTKYLGTQLDTRFLPLNGLNILVGLLYITQEGVRNIFYQQPYFLALKLHHNTICRFLFLFFGLTLLADSCWNFAETNNYIRYFALFFGWFGMIFFLRAIKFCGYHSVVFLEIITGDIIKFLPVVIVTLIPFTVAGYESFGNRQPVNTTGFRNYPEAVLTLFQWMNGLGEIGEVQNDTKPGLSIPVFVLFTIFCNIILLQTLIALMSNNHINDINRLHLRRVQRLSVIVFFESLLPRRLKRVCGQEVPFERSTGQKQTRFHLSVNRANDEDIEYSENDGSVWKSLLHHLRHDISILDTTENIISTGTPRTGISAIEID